MHVVVVEDESKIARLLMDYLEADGFQTTHVARGDAAVAAMLVEDVDLTLLDLNLPGKDGMQVAREVRMQSQVPIIMLTARVEEIDRLLGLEVGADDYVCKPFSPREVVARVRAVLRRSAGGPADESVIQLENMQLLVDAMEVRVGDAPVELTTVEFRLLHALLEKPGRVLSREQLMGRAYEDHRVVSDRTIDSHVKNLRRKLGPDCGFELRSVYGVGYKVD